MLSVETGCYFSNISSIFSRTRHYLGMPVVAKQWKLSSSSTKISTLDEGGWLTSCSGHLYPLYPYHKSLCWTHGQSERDRKQKFLSPPGTELLSFST